jgi:hypothetical protein
MVFSYETYVFPCCVLGKDGEKVFCSFFMNRCMGNGESKGKDTEAGQSASGVGGQGLGKDLDARLRELEEFLNGEFHERIKDFWPRALKLYVDNVFDVFGLEEQFGRLMDAITGTPSFYTKLWYHLMLSMRRLDKEASRMHGICPFYLGYYRSFGIRYIGGVCIDFYDAWVLEVGDSVRKKSGFIVLDFREARVRRCEVP